MNDIEKKSYIQMLLDTLQKQQQTLEEVLQITKKQSDIAIAPEFDELQLEETLNRKEILIAKLNQLDDGFSSVYGRIRNVMIAEKEAYANEIKSMQEIVKCCTDLGIEIRVLEERNREKLSQCFMGKQKQYGVQRNAATVASKYHQTMYSGKNNPYDSGFTT